MSAVSNSTSAPVPEAVSALRDRAIDATAKGFGVVAARGPVTAASLASRRIAAPGPDFTLPLLVLKDSALTHNAAAMARWCAEAGVLLAPHGKTTMAPQLFARQLAAGAWGITAATIGQVQIYRSFGINRILLANQLTDRAGIAWLAGELTADPGWDCYAYVDSVAGVRLLEGELRDAGARRPLPVLVELGFPGGRTGCREVGEALAVAAEVRRSAGLTLAGAAGYEGGLGHDTSPQTLDAVAAFCGRLRTLAGQLPGEPPGGGSWIVSAGGSSYFDVVTAVLTASRAGEPGTTVVLRSGCYITHDHGVYAALGPGTGRGGPELVPALELWTTVLSRPEPDLALACAGRRDVSFDQGMPVPLGLRRADGSPAPADGMTVTRLDDQHAYLSVPADADIAPGDLICLGISHPCMTFDKWQVIPVVDDDYRVVDVVHTFF
jgi:D-serine deaminase-like pyridoxal phosphate-dependent protein